MQTKMTSYSRCGYIAVDLFSLLSLLSSIIILSISKKTISPLEMVPRAALYKDLIHLSTTLIHVRKQWSILCPV